MTRRAFTPREYQQPVIDHILDEQRDATFQHSALMVTPETSVWITKRGDA